MSVRTAPRLRKLTIIKQCLIYEKKQNTTATPQANKTNATISTNLNECNFISWNGTFRI